MGVESPRDIILVVARFSRSLYFPLLIAVLGNYINMCKQPPSLHQLELETLETGNVNERILQGEGPGHPARWLHIFQHAQAARATAGTCFDTQSCGLPRLPGRCRGNDTAVPQCHGQSFQTHLPKIRKAARKFSELALFLQVSAHTCMYVLSSQAANTQIIFTRSRDAIFVIDKRQIAL